MRTVRKIVYVTGTRADFGLMRSTLTRIDRAPGLQLTILVTGMHLSPHFGLTVGDIEDSGLPIGARIDMLISSDTGGAMARGIGLAVVGISQALESLKPDLLLVLGDRGEMLAGCIAAGHLNIPVAHIHGGDLSGTIDESIRHAITKLSHIHLTTTQMSARRVRQLGENPKRIFCVGAPGLDDILHMRLAPRRTICSRYGLDPAYPYLLVVQHPVTQEIEDSGRQMSTTLRAATSFGIPVAICRPNADAGHTGITEAIATSNRRDLLHVFEHLPREDFLALMAHSKVLVGNSSSGIIESASLGIPAVNIGTRQNLRDRNPNVLDVGYTYSNICKAIHRSLNDSRFLTRIARRENIYGDGHASRRIVQTLKTAPLDKIILHKTFHPT